MNVYDWLVAASQTPDAQDIAIDLRGKTLSVNGRPLVVRDTAHPTFHGALWDPGFTVPFDGLIDFTGDPYAEIERLYAQYKRSVPGKQERQDRGNFRALSADRLTYQELETNMPRQEARLRLEGFILLAACAGRIRWQNPCHFFWQGTDPDLILYRDWIV